MGKSILIITLGVSLIIGFIILKLNTNATSGVEATMNKFDQTHARLIANSGIEIYLEKLKFDRTMLNKSFPNNILFNGNYDITIQGPDSLVKVTSIAKFMGVTHTSIVEARADRIPFEPSRAALYLHSKQIGSTKKNPKTTLTGHLYIDGHDHNYTEPYDSIPGNLSVPGIGVDDSNLRDTVVSMLSKDTLNHVNGFGGPPSVYAVPPDDVEWDEYAQDLADNPDIQIPDPSINQYDDWGTISNPKVTFIDAATFNNNPPYKPYAINASDVKNGGCGILVINGSVNFIGDFTYIGLVIAFKSTDVVQDFSIGGAGNTTIVGSLVGAGDKINLSINSGTFNVLYSSSALSLIENLIETKRFEILSWWE